MNFYGKYYESNRAGQCRYWYHFGADFLAKYTISKKWFGYWNIYYDGYFHFFSLYPFVFRWHKRPITKHEYIETHLK